jgi:hypothetical protein
MGTFSRNMNAKLTTRSISYTRNGNIGLMQEIYRNPKAQDQLFHQILGNLQVAKRLKFYQQYKPIVPHSTKNNN